MKPARDSFVVSLILSSLILCAALAFSQIDPRERYGTYLGGSLQDCYDQFPDNCVDSTGQITAGHHYTPADTGATAVAIDKQGYIYVAGWTNSVDFPTTTGAYDRKVHYADDSFGDQFSRDSFLSKFTSAGNLVWSTYLGLVATPQAISFDSSGNVIVAGNVNTGSLGRYPFYSPFVLKLNATATALVSYRQLLADGSCNSGYGEASSAAGTDAAGSIYFGGYEDYDQNCFSPTKGANQSGSGFVVKLNSALSTVYVARVDGAPAGIAADSGGNAYLTSQSASYSPYVAKLNTIGAFAFSFGFGNSGYGAAIRLASNGDVIATGIAGDGSFTATANFGTANSGGTEAFIIRLRSTGGVVYSAVIHDANMNPSGLALDSANEPFVTGSTSGFPRFAVNPYSNAPAAGGGFLVRLNQTGTALWLDSAFGGNAGTAIAVDSAWNAWVVGQSSNGQYFPITSGAYQSSFKNANSQGFLAKLIIEADVKALTQKISPNPVAHGGNLTYTFAVYNAGPDVSDGDTLTDVLPAGTTFVSFSTTNGTCTHPNAGSGGTFKCTRSAVLNKGSYWGPVTLTVHVNAASGSTLKNTVSVAAKTQDVFLTNNSSTTSVKVQ